jgi:hypothetical protein
MQLPPLEVLQSYPAPNYVDPVEHAPATSIVNLVFYPLICFLIALRIFTRLRISKSFGADDYLIILALVSIISFRVGNNRLSNIFLLYRFLLLASQLSVYLPNFVLDGTDMFGMCLQSISN